jgi:hypothetical protein
MQSGSSEEKTEADQKKELLSETNNGRQKSQDTRI